MNSASDKILLNKAFNIAKNPKYDGHQRGLASVVYNCFEKKTSSKDIKNENISNKESAEELHKPIIRKFGKRNYTHLLKTLIGCRFSRYAINK